jgi:hypothetical protein
VDRNKSKGKIVRIKDRSAERRKNRDSFLKWKSAADVNMDLMVVFDRIL